MREKAMSRLARLSVFFGWLLLIPFAGPAIAAERLNVLLITTDDMSCDSVGVFGCRLKDTTPNMDRLAHRGVRFEPFFSDQVILACPPGHRFAGRTVTLEDVRDETLILMQDGAGVRQIVEDALRKQTIRLRDLDVRLELGLQESVRRAVEAGYGITFISRTAIESNLEIGRAHV